jgi:hypothetical protein
VREEGESEGKINSHGMLLKINSTCFAVDLTDCSNFKIINELFHHGRYPGALLGGFNEVKRAALLRQFIRRHIFGTSGALFGCFNSRSLPGAHNYCCKSFSSGHGELLAINLLEKPTSSSACPSGGNYSSPQRK